MGRFAELFPDSVQVLVNTFLPLLTMILQNAASCDRVRGHAASALINLLDPEACDTSVLLPFLDPLLAAMVQTFQTSSIEVQTPCLNLLGYTSLFISTEMCVVVFNMDTLLCHQVYSEGVQRIFLLVLPHFHARS